MVPPPVPVPPLPAAQRAGFWLRAVAWGIDALVAWAAGWVASFAAIVALDAAGAPQALADYVGGMVMVAAYLAYTLFEVFKAATPGKMVFGLVITTSRGVPADRWTLALRWSTKNAYLLYTLIYMATLSVMGQFLAGVLNYAFLIGCLQALDEDRRTWHDEWSGTAVYRRPPRPAPAPAWPAAPPLRAGR